MADSEYRVVTVCLGNICRSPIAEAVLRAAFRDAGLEDAVTVASAGTAGYHTGDDADPRAKSALVRAGYQIDHRARQFDWRVEAEADLILAMDHANLSDLHAGAPSSQHRAIVRPLRSFDPGLADLTPGDPDLEVPDPYYGSSQDFDAVVEMIERAAPGVVSFVRAELASS